MCYFLKNFFEILRKGRRIAVKLLGTFLKFRYSYTMNSNSATDNKAIHSPVHRWIENGHIFLWLIKDTCWVNEWKIGGITMIVPTLSVAIYILWRSRKVKSELFHNLAICLWISGNSVWMVGEFFKQETRHYAFGLFLIGLAFMLYYYIFIFPKERKKRSLICG